MLEHFDFCEIQSAVTDLDEIEKRAVPQTASKAQITGR